MRASAWDDISSPSDPSTETIRRADKNHPLEFFRGKDHRGRHLFMFRVRGSNEDFGRLPNFAGIDAIYEPVSSGLWQLKLTLRETQQSDVFVALCTNLMEATRRLNAAEQAKGIGVVLARLRRWQQMLKFGKSELMSEDIQIGLYGELLFLKDVLRPRLSGPNALQCWRGPFGEEQDFSIGPALVEIKTQRSTSDRRIHISSPDQLHSYSGRIVLCHQTVTTRDDAAAGASLNALVKQLTTDMENADPETADVFRSILLDFGYEERFEYNEPVRALQRRDFYDVSQFFPRITPKMLPAGVVDVSYSIDVEACSAWITDERTIWREPSDESERP